MTLLVIIHHCTASRPTKRVSWISHQLVKFLELPLILAHRQSTSTPNLPYFTYAPYWFEFLTSGRKSYKAHGTKSYQLAGKTTNEMHLKSNHGEIVHGTWKSVNKTFNWWQINISLIYWCLKVSPFRLSSLKSFFLLNTADFLPAKFTKIKKK